MIREIDLGNLPINVSVDNYNKYFNQQEKQESKTNRVVFQYDYQRFIWAFVLGIKKGIRTPLDKKKSSFKWQVIPSDSRSLLMGLVLQELYKDNPDQIKVDLKNATDNSFNDQIRQAIEEYANTGFDEITVKTIYNPTYIEDFEAVVEDILDNTTI